MSISAPRYSGGAVPDVGRGGRVFAIFLNEVRTRAGWGTYAVLAISYLAVVIIVVLDTEFASLVGSVDLATFHAPYSSPIWPYLILIVATTVSAGSIADDLSSRAITLYLSRPIHLSDYLAAKTAAVAFWVGIASIGPGLIGVTIASGLGLVSFDLAWQAVGAFLAVGALTTLFFTALGVALSTITARALYAGVGIFGATLSANIAGAAVYGATQSASVSYVSPVSDILAVAEAAFQTNTPTLTPPGASAALLLAAAVILLIVTWARLTRVEVVGE